MSFDMSDLIKFDQPKHQVCGNLDDILMQSSNIPLTYAAPDGSVRPFPLPVNAINVNSPINNIICSPESKVVNMKYQHQHQTQQFREQIQHQIQQQLIQQQQSKSFILFTFYWQIFNNYFIGPENMQHHNNITIVVPPVNTQLVDKQPLIDNDSDDSGNYDQSPELQQTHQQQQYFPNQQDLNLEYLPDQQQDLQYLLDQQQDLDQQQQQYITGQEHLPVEQQQQYYSPGRQPEQYIPEQQQNVLQYQPDQQQLHLHSGSPGKKLIPPTAEEMNAYEGDDSDDEYEEDGDTEDEGENVVAPEEVDDDEESGIIDDEDDDNQSSLVSLEEESVTPQKIRTSPREQPVKRAVSAVIFRSSIAPARKDVTRISMPKGKWIPKTFKPKYPILKTVEKAGIVKFCDVVFGTSPPDSDSVMVYNSNLKLLSLKKACAELSAQVRKDGSKSRIQHSMVRSAHGEALRLLSTNYSLETNQYFRSVINNVSLDYCGGNYPLLYGVVPDLSYTTFILTKYHKTSSANEKLLVEGDLEIGSYCYYILANTDLIKWKNDLNRQTLKQLLLFLVQNIPDKAYRLKIAGYIEADKIKYITAESMLLLKHEFENILLSYNNLEDSKRRQYQSLWHSFFEKCGVHHYFCPHTQIEIARGIKLIGKKLINKLADLELQNEDCESGLKFSFEEIKLYYSFVTHLKEASNIKDLKLLHKITNSTYNHLLKMFASHLVFFGIYPSSIKITAAHIQGFANKYHKLLSLNNLNCKIPIMESKFASAEKVVTSQIQLDDQNSNMGKGIKFERDAIIQLFNTINMIILKRIEPILFEHPRNESIAKTMCSALKEVLDSDDFVCINDLAAWSRVDDEAIDINDYDSSDDSDYELSDGEVENDEDIWNEEQGLKMDMLEGPKINSISDIIEKPKKTMPVKRKLPAQGNNDGNTKNDYNNNNDNAEGEVNEQQPPEKIRKREYKPRPDSTKILQAVNNSPYVLLEEKIPRIACTMCDKSRTHKAVSVALNMEVACCVKCYKRLVIDFMSAEPKYNHDSIISRLENRYKRPVAFNKETGEFITDAEVDKTKARNNYNRKQVSNIVDDDDDDDCINDANGNSQHEEVNPSANANSYE